jgi:S1 RNA binding domain
MPDIDNAETKLAVWRLFLERIRLGADLDTARSQGDLDRVVAAEEALALLPEVAALDALKANADLIAQLGAQRWIAMKVARDEGANMEQIGDELSISRQAAWEFLRRKIEEHGGEVEGRPPDGGDETRWEALQRKIADATPTADQGAWQSFTEAWAAGDVVEGRVTKVVPFGAFITGPYGIDGLLPRSLAPELPEVGQRVTVRIVSLDPANLRVSYEQAE